MVRKKATSDITIYILSFCLSSASVVNDLELFYVFMGSWYGVNTKLALSKWVFLKSSDFFLEKELIFFVYFKLVSNLVLAFKK